MPIIKKNLIILYPSSERGGVEENIKNLINNFCKKTLKRFDLKKMFVRTRRL